MHPAAPAVVDRPSVGTARKSHAFNLFGLPPVFLYEIKVPPHVYLAVALVLYCIGPPALIPVVAAFFFYRWHLQQRQQVQQQQQQHEAQMATLAAQGSVDAVSKMPSAASASVSGGGSKSMGGIHPSGVPKTVPATPPQQVRRRQSNIHSLYDD